MITLKDANNFLAQTCPVEWKDVGLNLDLSAVELDVIEYDNHYKAKPCGREMLKKWLQVDVSASWEKLRSAVKKSTPAGKCSKHVLSEIKPYFQKSYKSLFIQKTKYGYCNQLEFINVAFINHKNNNVEYPEIEAVANKLCSGEIYLSDNQTNIQILLQKHYFKACKITSDVFKLLNPLYTVKPRVPFLLLIEGAPGMGKSYISKEIAYQWAIGSFTKPEMLFYLCLHDKLNEANTICSFANFLEFVYPSQESEVLSTHLSNTKGKGVTVIIDGYDKISSDLQNHSSVVFFDQLISRTVPQLQKCDIIITSNRTTSGIIYKVKNCIRIELIGFTEDFKQQYIRCAFKNKNKDMKDLMEYLSAHPTLNSLCYIPMCLATVVSQFKRSREMYDVALPSHRTETINRLVCIMILQVALSSNKHIAELFSKLPKERQLMLAEVSKIAFCALKEGREVFKLEDLKETFPNISKVQSLSLYGFGFLNGFNHFQPLGIDNVYFSFLHYSLRDYLAAFHVTLLPKEKQLQWWNETFWKSMYLDCWAYYCKLSVSFNAVKVSLLKGYGTPGLSSSILNNKIKCLYLVYCLMESPNDDIYQQVRSVVIKDSVLDLSNYRLTSKDLDIFALFLSKHSLSQWSSLNLSSCSIDDSMCAVLLEILYPLQRNLPIINKLNVAHNQISFTEEILNMTIVFDVSQLDFSFNKIEDEQVTQILISPTHVISNKLTQCRLWLINNNQSCFVFSIKHKDVINKCWSNGTFNKLYVIRCLLDNAAVNKLLDSLKLQSYLSSIFLFDTNVTSKDFLKMIKFLKTETQVNGISIFEKSLSDQTAYDVYTDIVNYQTVSHVLLVSQETIQAQRTTNQQILQALAYNPSIMHLELMQCYLTHEIMKRIATILNESLIQWKMLGLVGCKIDDNALTAFCNTLETPVKVNVINLSGNRLSSACLLCELACCLNPETVDITDNEFPTNDNYFSVIAKNLFAFKKQFSITLTSDSGLIKFCHKMNLTAVKFANLSQLIINNCIVSGEMLLQTMKINDSLSFLHLSNIAFNGESFYKSAEFVNNYKVIISICENSLPNEVVNTLINVFDSNTNISRIVSTDDLFMAYKCSFELLRWHLNEVVSPEIQNLVYIRNCPLQKEPSDCNILKEYLSRKHRVSEIVLCNNIIDQEKVDQIIEQLKFPSRVFICDFQPKSNGNWVVQQLAKHNHSLMIVGKRVVVGEKASIEQLSRAMNLMSPSTTVLRLLNCNFNTELCRAFTAVLATCKDLDDFTFHDCSISDIWTDQMMKALKETHKLRYLFLSTTTITSKNAESIASALATVIRNNTSLKRLSIKFYNLEPSACSLIFQAISQIQSLRQLRFCRSQVNTETALHKLRDAIASNQLLEIINLSNNNLETIGIIKIAESLKSIHKLQILALNNNLITEEAADVLAEVIANNLELEKLILHDNALKSEGVKKICRELRYHVKLKVFRISNNNVQKDAATDIARAINNKKLLQIMDVGNNKLMTQGIIKIANALKSLDKLKELGFNSNYITQEAADSITSVIMNNSNLEKIHLENNDLNATGISKICAKLQNLSTLQALFIGSNGITQIAASDIAGVIANNPKLEYVDLGNNLLQTEGVLIIANGLQHIHYLTLLGLCNNQITKEAAKSIASVINSNTALEKLWLNHNRLGTKGIQIICEALENISSLKLLHIMYNNITEESTNAITNVISNNPLLETVCIGGNYIQHASLLWALKAKYNLKILGLRDIHITAEAADDIVAVIENNPFLEDVDIGNNKLKSLGIIKITKAMENLSHLRVLSFDNNQITDKAADDIAKLLIIQKGLQKLWLNDNKLGTTGVKKICQSLKEHSNLKLLQLENNLITEEATEDIALVISNNLLIESLWLGINKLKSEGVIKVAIAAKKLHHLRMLCFSSSGITEDAADYISEIIINNSGLEILFLDSNRLGALGIQKICHGLKHNSGLKLISIENNFITEKAADDIASVIDKNPLLKRIYLGNNKIQPKGVIKIFNALKNVNQLKELSMNNSQISEAISEISEAIACSHAMNKLLLCNSNITDKSIRMISIALKSINTLKSIYLSNNSITEEAADDIAAMIKYNASLNYLHLNNNKLKATGVIKLSSSLKQLCQLKELNLSCNDITEDAADDIAAVIDNNPLLECLFLSNNKLKTQGIVTISRSLKQLQLLKVLDLSNNFITEEPADDIAAMITNNPLFKRLYFSNNMLNSGGVKTIATALEGLSNLIILSLNDNQIGDDATYSIARVIASNRKLEELWLSRNQLTDVGIQNICKYLKQNPSLRIFHLGENSITEETIDDIAAVLNENTKYVYLCGIKLKSVAKMASTVKSLSNLKLLALNNNQITEAAACSISETIANNTEITQLWMYNNQLKSSEAKALCKGLKQISSLTKLYLYNNGMTEAAAQNIAAGFDNNPLLESVNIGGNNFKTQGILKLCCSLKQLNQLKELDISNNSITKEAASEIAEVIINNPLLEYLYLGNNNFQSEGVIELAIAAKQLSFLKILEFSRSQITENAADEISAVVLNNKGLEQLWLNNNRLGTIGVQRLCCGLIKVSTLKLLNLQNNSITETAAFDIAAVITNNPLLECIYFGYNTMKTRGVLILSNSLKQLHHLKELCLSSNEITEEAASEIAAIISSNPNLDKLSLFKNSLGSKGISKISFPLKHTSTLKCLHISKNNITEEAVCDIADVITNNPLLEIIAVGGNKFKSTGALKLANALKLLSQLKILDLSDIYVANDVANAIARMIAKNSKLEKLWLNNTHLNTIGIQVLCKSLSQLKSLKVMCLNRNNFSNEKVADYVATVINNNPLLKCIRMSNCKVTSAGVIRIANALKRLCYLEVLEFHGNQISGDAASHIAEVIYFNSVLKIIWLSNNQLETTGIKIICESLQKNSTLKLLSLNNNSITEEAADVIAAVITNNPLLTDFYIGNNILKSPGMIKIANAFNVLCNMKHLSFSSNQITEGAAKHIAEALSYHSRLESLWLNDNQLKTAGIQEICKVLKQNSALKLLSLNNNFITEEAADDIAAVITNNPLLTDFYLGNNSLKSAGAIRIANALKGLCDLKHLSFSSNQITEGAAKHIAEALSYHSRLESLWLNDNQFKTAGIQEICKVLQQNSSLKLLNLINNFITEQAADDIAAVITRSSFLTNFYTSNNNLKSAGVIRIANALKGLCYLKELDFSGNQITESAVDDISRVIVCLSGLEKLWLNNNELNTIGIQTICRSLGQISNLKLLHLENNHITDEAADDIAKVITNNPLLTDIYIGINNLKSVGIIKVANALKELSYLKVLDLNTNQITKAVSSHIAEVIFHNSKLESLWLKNNKFEAIGIQALCKSLQQNSDLKFLDLNNNSITEEATNDIAAVITNNPLLTGIYVHSNDLKSAGVIKLASALKLLCNLKELDFSNVQIMEDAANDIAEIIFRNNKMEKLWLNDNHLKAAGIKAICKSLKQNVSLKLLNVNNSNITEEVADDIAAVIANNLLLTHFYVGNNKLKSAGVIRIANALKKLHCLRELDFSGNQITEDAANDICEIIASNSQLEELSLSDNKLKVVGIQIICKGLKGISNLRLLHLENNYITEEAGDDVAAVISNNPLLASINVGNNYLKSGGVIKIANAIKGLSYIKNLSFNGNQITEDAASHIAEVIFHNRELERLWLNDNHFKPVGIITICKTLRQHSALKLLNFKNNFITEEAANDITAVIINNPLLENINLGNNELKSGGILMITNALKRHYHLTSLDLSANQITINPSSHIAEAFTCNNVLEELLLNNNHITDLGMQVICKGLMEISTLRVLHLGNNFITEKSADDISALISNNSSLECINLDDNKLKSNGIITIANALKNLSQLVKLGLSNNEISEDAASDIAEVITSNNKLKKIWLNNNLLNTRGIQKICNSLKHISTLELLNLQNNGLTEEVGDDIAAVINNNPLLETFVILCNDLKTKGISIICNSLKNVQQLKELGLGGNGITKEAAKDIAAVINNNTLLTSIDIGYNKLKSSGIIVIANSLKNLSYLKDVSFNNTQITEDAADEIAEMIANNSRIEQLFLGNNQLKAAGIQKICKKLKQISTIKLLGLGNNSITEEAAGDIAGVIEKNPLLEAIDIENNKLKSSGISIITDALKKLSHLINLCFNNNNITEDAANGIAEVIASNKKLEKLLLNNNQLKAEGIQRISKHLKNTSTLSLLWLRNNSITDNAADDIAAVINNNPLLEFLDLGDNKLESTGVLKIINALKNLLKLKGLDLTNSHITGDAVDCVAEVIAKNSTKLTSLILHNTQLNTGGIQKICKALRQISTLKKLSLGNSATSKEAADDIAAVVLNNPLLEYIDVGGYSYPYDKLKSHGTIRICSSLKRIHLLKVLGLYNNDITEEAADEISQVICSNVSLENLFLFNNVLKDKGISKITVQLQKVCTLKIFNVNNNGITEKAADGIAAMIKNNIFLEIVDIGNNELRSSGMIKIANSLKNLSQLRSLDIGSNQIEEDAADAVAEAIACNAELENLMINDNQFGGVGIKKICISLQQAKAIKMLNLENNSVTEEAADDIAAVISNNLLLDCVAIGNNLLQVSGVIKITHTLQSLHKLSRLTLSGNQVGKEAVINTAQAISKFHYLQMFQMSDSLVDSSTAQTILNSFKNIFSLSVLDLAGNNMYDEVTSDLVNLISNNKSLEILCLCNNNFTVSGGKLIVMALKYLKLLRILRIDKQILNVDVADQLVISVCTTGQVQIMIYSDNHQTKGVIRFYRRLCVISELLLHKVRFDTGNAVAYAAILNNGFSELIWTQDDALDATGALIMINAVKNIITLKIAGCQLTEQEAEGIASIVTNSTKIENFILGLKQVPDADIYFAMEVLVLANGINTSQLADQNRLLQLAANSKNIVQLRKSEIKLVDTTSYASPYLLITLKNVKILFFYDVVINEAAAEHLAMSLASSTKLEVFALEHNCSLNDTSVKVIAGSLQFCNTLRRFGFTWSNITQNSADAIAAVIESNREFQALYLYGNCSFNTKRLSNAISYLNNLTYLQINSSLVVEDLTYEFPNVICNNDKLNTVMFDNYSMHIRGKMNLHTPSKNIKSVMLIKVYTTGNNELPVSAFSKDDRIYVRWSQNNTLASIGLLRVISAFRNITSLTLCNNTVFKYNNQDADEMALMLASFTKLEEFYLLNNCLNTTISLHNVLISLSKLNGLKVIHLFGSKVDDKAVDSMAIVLAKNKSMQELTVYNCFLNSKNAIFPLKNLSTIKKLSLYSNFITDEAADDISDVISINNVMEEFSIGENRLKVNGMIKILLSLTNLKSLKELSISGNDVSEDISSYVIPVIAANLNLASLDLEGVCVHLGGITNVVNALKSLKCLTFLDISKNNISKEVADSFATVITNNTSLENLRISENNLGITGVTKLTTALVALEGIKKLSLINTNITDKSADKIAEVIVKHHSLHSLLLGEACLDTPNDAADSKMTGLENFFIKNKIQKEKRLAKLLGPESYNVVKATNEFNVIGIGKLCIKRIELQGLFPILNCSVCLSKLPHNKLQSHGAIVISKALADIKSLEILSIENNEIDDLAVDDIATALASNSGIKQLWVGENLIKSSGISTILQPLIKAPNASLEVLELSHINLLLKTVDDTSAVLLKNSKMIKQLWLEGNDLSLKCFMVMSDTLIKCTSISLLNLRSNNIDEMVADVLSKVLTNKIELRQLYLGNNLLQDAGAIKIMAALNTTCGHGLHTLDLMNNNISEAVADALTTAITNCAQLEQLYLGDNKLQSTGAVKVVRAIQHGGCRSTLRVLGLSNNKIGSDDTVANEISIAVATIELLTVLLLDDNEFSVNGLLTIVEAVQGLKWMMILSMMNNDASEEEKGLLKSTFDENPSYKIYM